MANREKIILMTKLALHDKKYSRTDRQKLSYYMEDYIYINNLKTRIGIHMMTIIIAIIGTVKFVENEAIFPETIHEVVSLYIKPYLIPWLILVISYTFISSMIYAKQYKEAQRRQKEYKSLLKQLEACESSVEGALHETS